MNQLVYSSNDKSPSKGKNKQEKNSEKSYKPGKGPMKVRLEKKGRAGKSVTVLYDIPLTKEAAKDFKKALQQKFGCGATIKGSTIELAGDLVEKVRNIKLDEFVS